jgi:hypothetical protein
MLKGESIDYEWCILEFEDYGAESDIKTDIRDHEYIRKLSECPPEEFCNVELVRNFGSDDSGLLDRSWFSIENWRHGERRFNYGFPECNGHDVPLRFLAEIDKYIAANPTAKIKGRPIEK